MKVRQNPSFQAIFAVLVILFLPAWTAAPVWPRRIPIEQFANGRSLLQGVTIHGDRGRYELLGAKNVTIGKRIYWGVPIDTGTTLSGFAAFAIFEVQHRRLILLARVPEADTPSRYGYGWNLEGSHITVERPYDEKGKRCCKYDKYFEYAIDHDTVRLVYVHLELELP